jgi:hypothetical protein
VPVTAPVRITADWLRAQPGVSFGDVSFHLLDAEGQPLDAWPGLSVEREAGGAGQAFNVLLKRNAPDDIYLYAAYPGQACAFDQAELAPGRSAEYLFLAVPHRIADVVVLGLVRAGAHRGQPAVPGLALTVRFDAGRERTYRETSLVNEDADSAPVLEVGTAPGGGVRLGWDERNIGDYDNNSQVGIADLTPLGINFGKTLAGSPEYAELLLVDGDGNGVIGVSDVTPIGRNFARFIQGFTAYHATVSNPAPGDFTAVAKPSIMRQSVWDAATPAERKRRLRYIYDPPYQTGPNAYYVRAYSADGGDESEGPQSNIVSRDIQPGNQPPVWESIAGLSSAVGGGEGIDVVFWRALDPELDPLSYTLVYIAAPGTAGDPGSLAAAIPPAVVAGNPPYAFHLGGLTPGAQYSLMLQVSDGHNDPLAGDVLSATVPELAGSSDPWPYHRGGPERTGLSAGVQLAAPLQEKWTYTLGASLPQALPETPVVSAQGWVGAFAADGSFKRVDMATGALLATHPAPAAPHVLSAAVHPALDGDRMAVGAVDGVAVYDLSGSAAPTAYTGPGEVQAAPLLLGDYIITADLSGAVRALSAGTGAEHWSFSPAPAAPYTISPATDGASLYALRSDGRLDKLDLLTGAAQGGGMLPAAPAGDAIALDAQRGRLYAATVEDRLVEIDSASLSTLRRWSFEANEWQPTAPCLLTHLSPPLALSGVAIQSMIESPGLVVAINLDTGAEAWRFETAWLAYPKHISAAGNLLLANCSGPAYLLDFAGRERQKLTGAGSLHGELALAGDSAFAITGQGELKAYRTAPQNLPPVWHGHEGVARASKSAGSVTVEWDYATDPEQQAVYYAIYYSAGAPPSFTAPFLNTTVITDIPAGGEGADDPQGPHSYTIPGLSDAETYYVGVRAGDAPWAESPAMDPNTNWVVAGPPWQREELLSAQDFPDGEVYFMRGVADPGGALHLVYSDATTGFLVHVWGTTGAWQWEGNTRGPFVSFEPIWDGDEGRLKIGYATTDSVGILARTGSDTWDDEAWNDALPVQNPQITVAATGGLALAYTRYITGEFPVITEYYYLRRAIDGTLGGYEKLDDQNYCGRDLDLVLNPEDGNDPWVAFQRGVEAAPGRLTPEKGSLLYSRSNGGSGFDLQTVDAGGNSPDSDCGVRVQQVLDAGGKPRVAYLDLNASSTEPRGQLKYASYDGSAWHVETVDDFDLSFQPGSLQFTYGELGFALTADGRPVIAMLQRLTQASSPNDPHLAEVRVWSRSTSGAWGLERPTDAEEVFPRDREPCVLLIAPDGTWHVFFVTYKDQQARKADKIVHLYSSGQ